MAKKIDIHNYEYRVNQCIRSIEKANISNKNKELIFEFKDACFIEGLTKARISRLLSTMKLMAQRLEKDFDKANKKDIIKLVQEIHTNENYAYLTKHTHKVILKKFYKWLKGNNETYPEEVSWIEGKIKRSQLSLPSEEGLLTEKEVKKVVKTATGLRDKALISVLYESGCRIGEVMSCRINNVTFDKHGCSLVVNGKTGSRKVRIIASTPYLANWIEHHPFKEDRESPLWVNLGNNQKSPFMNYSATVRVIQRLFKKAGINKKCNPHLFRHSRATFLANYLTEFQMNHYFGWIQGSDMPATYVHMSGKDVDNALLDVYGIEKIKRKESTLRPKRCPRCETLNGYNNKFCNKCGGVLDLQKAMELEHEQQNEKETKQVTDIILGALMKDSEMQQLIERKIPELKLKEEINKLN